MQKTERRISFDEALRVVTEALGRRDAVPLDAREAAGCVLRDPLVADRDLPPFHRAAMDGYALRGDELGRLESWAVAGVLLAGGWPPESVGPGAALKIMTGAALPRELDTIVPVERSDEAEGQVRFDRLPEAGANVHRRGSDAPEGSELVAEGSFVRPETVALAAAVGSSRLLVSRPLRARVLSTGSEVVSAERRPAAWEIRDLNGPLLEALLREEGGTRFLGRSLVADDESGLRRAVEDALVDADLLVLSGGVSEGDRDLVPAVLGACGVRRLFHKMAVRPGNPIWVGLSERGVPVFALPGNPVAVRVLWHVFVRPCLWAWLGASDPSPRRFALPLVEDLRFRPGYRRFVLARVVRDVSGHGVAKVSSQGSGDFLSAGRAEGVMAFAAEADGARAGDLVDFLPF